LASFSAFLRLETRQTFARIFFFAGALTVRTKAIQNVVLYNRACFFVAKRLRDYQSSRINVVTSILSLVGLLLLTVIVFALIDYATFKMDASLFRFTYAPRAFFSFVYYSTGSIFYASNGLVPVAAISQGIQLLEMLFGVVLLVIFGAILLTMKSERYTADLNQVITTAESEGRAMEGTLRREFNIDGISNAIAALQDAKSDMIGFILFVTKGLDGE
jgi:hypothetical protein